MTAQGIYLNVSRRNEALPEMIEEYSEKFNLSKADTVAEILREYPKLLAYKHRPQFPTHRTRNLWHTTNSANSFFF